MNTFIKQSKNRVFKVAIVRILKAKVTPVLMSLSNGGSEGNNTLDQ